MSNPVTQSMTLPLLIDQLLHYHGRSLLTIKTWLRFGETGVNDLNHLIVERDYNPEDEMAMATESKPASMLPKSGP